MSQLQNNQLENEAKKSVKSSKNILNKVGKKTISASKKIAKATMDSAKTAATISKVIAAVVSIFGAPVAIVVAIMIVVLLVLSPSMFLSTQTDLEKMQNSTTGVINSAYEYAKYQSYKQVSDYINKKYNCDAYSTVSKSDVYSEDYDNGYETFYYYDSNIVDGKHYMENKKNICDIDIVYTPSAEDAVDNINAYANAVNGTLGTVGYGKIEPETDSEVKELSPEESTEFTNDYIYSNEEERENMIIDAKTTVDENGNEYETQLNDKYVSTLKSRISDIFFADNEGWDDKVEYKKDVVVGYEQKLVCDAWQKCVDKTVSGHGNTVCNKYVACSKDDKNAECAHKHYEDDYTRPIKKDVAKGTITIHMNYDVNFYKKEAIETLTKSFAEENDVSEQEANDTIQEVLYNKYVSFLDAYGLQSESDGVFAGIDAIFMENGSKGFDGDFEVYGYQSPFYTGTNDCYRACSSGTVLNHIRNKFGISSNTVVQCVAFTNSWLEDAYGIRVSGNGQNLVGNLVREHNWELLDEPAPGAVFSISAYGSPGCTYSQSTVDTCNPYGHTGIILSVHGDEVVLAESNVGADHIYRVRTVSKVSLLTGKYYKGKIKFAITK